MHHCFGVNELWVGVHVATARDKLELDAFPQLSGDSQSMMSDFKNKPNRNLLCLDWDTWGDEIEIWST